MKHHVTTESKQIGNIHFIPGTNKGKYPFCHSLFIDDEVKVLVDPSADPDKLKALTDGKGVDVILLSHYHEDHWTYMHMFPDAAVYIHGLEAKPMTSLENLLDFYGMERGTDECERYVSMLTDFFKYNPKPPEKTMSHGDVFKFGSTVVEVIHTPGHSPGHCCFNFPEQDVLFLADYDLTRFGPWYGDNVSDIDQFIESSKLIRYHPAKYKVPAHEGGVFEGDLEDVWTMYMGVIDKRQEELEEALRERPLSIENVVNLRIIYRKVREPKSFFDFGEKALMGKHLERMVKNGSVIKENGIFKMVK